VYSIRRRLLLTLSIGFSVLILAVGFFLVQALGAASVEEFDVALEAKVRALAALCEEEDGQIEFDYTPAAMPEFERKARPDHFQFWLGDGQMLMRSTHLDADLEREPQGVGSVLISDSTLPDGRAMRQAQLTFIPRDLHPGDESPEDDEANGQAPSGGPDAAADVQGQSAPEPPRGLVLVVARGRERLDALLGTMRWTVFGSTVLAMLLAGVVAWRAVAAGLRPVDAIAAQVQALDAGNLDARVQVMPQPVELAPVVEQLNALLSRLGASFERERRFTGNVAHELRTPISELRSLASVAAKWPDDPQAVAQFFQDVQDVAVRMERVIVDLLMLARCQAGVEAVTQTTVPLEPMLRAVLAPLQDEVAARGLSVTFDVTPALEFSTDAGKLELALANLLGNAVSYARHGTTIHCLARRVGRVVEIEIRNEAEALDPASLVNLTEPFWRGDPARSSAHHAGLGLSLVDAIARLLGFELGFSQEGSGTFCVRLRIAGEEPGARHTRVEHAHTGT
jgi:two-component system sensor histidine kinase QseC